MSDLDPVSVPLREALRRLGLTDIEHLLRIVADWAEIAGSNWEAAAPVRLDGGELTVEASDAAVVRVLRYDSAALRDRINAALGRPVVQAIRVVPPR